MGRTNGENWINRALEWASGDWQDNHEPVDRIELRQRTRGNEPDDCIAEFIFNAGDDLDEEIIRSKISDMLSVAQNDANEQDRAGSFSYYIAAVADGVTIARSTAKKFENLNFGGDDYEDEPGTAKSLVAQTQRHLESILKTTSLTTIRQMQMLGEQNAHFMRREHEMLERERESLQREEKARSEEHERLMELKRQESEHENRQDLLKTVKGYIPHIVARLGSKTEPLALPAAAQNDGAPAEASRELKMANCVNRFMQSIKPEQMEQIMCSIDPSAGAPLMELLEIVNEVAPMDESEGNNAAE
jgi:hypothetical protein